MCIGAVSLDDALGQAYFPLTCLCLFIGTRTGKYLTWRSFFLSFNVRNDAGGHFLHTKAPC